MRVIAALLLAACQPPCPDCPAPTCPEVPRRACADCPHRGQVECAPCPPPDDALAIEAGVVTRYLCREAFGFLADGDRTLPTLRERVKATRGENARMAFAYVADCRRGVPAATLLADDLGRAPGVSALPDGWQRVRADWDARFTKLQPRAEYRVTSATDVMTFACPVYLGDTTSAFVVTGWK